MHASFVGEGNLGPKPRWLTKVRGEGTELNKKEKGKQREHGIYHHCTGYYTTPTTGLDAVHASLFLQPL